MGASVAKFFEVIFRFSRIPESLEDFQRSPFVPRVVLFLWRLAAGGFCLACTIIRNTIPRTYQDGQYWNKFTHISFAFLTLFFLNGALITLMGLISPYNPDKCAKKKGGMLSVWASIYIFLNWVTFPVQIASAIALTIVYYTLLDDGAANWTSYVVHGGSAGLGLVELFLSDVDVIPGHVVFMILYLSVYLVVVGFWLLATGQYIYGFLAPGRLAPAYYLGIFALFILMFFLVYGLYRLRVVIANAVNKDKTKDIKLRGTVVNSGLIVHTIN